MNSKAQERMNQLGKAGRPFLFVIDFDGLRPIIVPLDELSPADILYQVHGQGNYPDVPQLNKAVTFNKFPVAADAYRRAFEIVHGNLSHGNSYLLNLTFPTPVETNLSLEEVFHHSQAPYKLYIKDQFVVFSPEIFVQIRNGKIFSHPMKGTIDADLSGAEEILLADPKELAEHNTIVDLIRNDLSRVAKRVRVDQFRYIDRLITSDKNLLQCSSQISGILPDNYAACLGDIFQELLPAGSISGAPKKKTLEIIHAAETYQRGYYTGVFGVFDGKQLDSGVMIRFIEQGPNGLIFKSGGGITVNSQWQKEYSELIDKVYVPITGNH